MSSQRKLLIQMSGAPGSGKTTLAKLLSHSIKAIVIDHDLLKSFFLGADISFEQAGKLAYRLTWTLAADLLAQGQSVIIDSTCNFSEVLDRGTALAQQHACEYKYIECRVRVEDIEVLDQRIRSRVPLRSQRMGVQSPPADSSGARHVGDQMALFRRWIENPCRPPGDYLVVDSIRYSPPECLEYILANIGLSGTNFASKE